MSTGPSRGRKSLTLRTGRRYIARYTDAPPHALAALYRLPAVYAFRRYVAEGGLISYGTDQSEPYRQAAGYIDRILKGERPIDLPVRALGRYEIALNKRTAEALGLNVPAHVLPRVNGVIE